MADRPILFSAPMVRALLAGTKTQTRRVLKPQPAKWRAQVIDITKPTLDEDEGGWGQWETEWSSPSFYMPMGEPKREIWRPLRGLRYAVGDRIWVREAWKAHSAFNGIPPRDITNSKVFYLADNAYSPSGAPGRPSMFMPRWASRLTLTVTDVRVQRLQDLSEDDAFEEGVETDVWDQAPVARRYDVPEGWFVGWPGMAEPCVSVDDDSVCRESYRTLWDSINGAGAWDANPWVAAYTFTVERRNIDAGA